MWDDNSNEMIYVRQLTNTEWYNYLQDDILWWQEYSE